MSGDLLALFCLVDGHSISQAFEVKASNTTTISGLKKLIKAEKAPRFDDVAADELILWRVFHPAIAANEDQPVLLSAINSPTKLNPTHEIFDVFPEAPPKKTIHIIVQRPPPGNSNLFC